MFRMRAGFTLIELLVVIAIIAILAAILFPVFARAREKARQTACLSNVKQIMLGVLMYAQDNDEHFPPYRWVQEPPSSVWVDRDNSAATNRHFWVQAIEPYLRNDQILFCPSSPYGPGTVYNGKRYLTYAYNGKMNYTRMASFSNPASKIALGDLPVRHDDRNPPGYVENWFISTSNDTLWYQYGWWSDIHNGGGNYAFMDGHAKWLSDSDAMLGPVVPTGSSLTGDQTGAWFPE